MKSPRSKSNWRALALKTITRGYASPKSLHQLATLSLCSPFAGGWRDRFFTDFRSAQRVRAVCHGILSCRARASGFLVLDGIALVKGWPSQDALHPRRLCTPYPCRSVFCGDLAFWHWSINLTSVANSTFWQTRRLYSSLWPDFSCLNIGFRSFSCWG